MPSCQKIKKEAEEELEVEVEVEAEADIVKVEEDLKIVGNHEIEGNRESEVNLQIHGSKAIAIIVIIMATKEVIVEGSYESSPSQVRIQAGRMVKPWSP